MLVLRRGVAGDSSPAASGAAAPGRPQARSGGTPPGAIPGVEVVGQVPDVRPDLAGAAVAVNPLRIVRGIQNKVLEAMAMSKAVIASPQALAGLGRRDDAPVLCARSPEEWVVQVGKLLDQPEERRRLGVEGRRYVERNHDWERCLRPFDPLLGLYGKGAAALSAAEGRP